MSFSVSMVKRMVDCWLLKWCKKLSTLLRSRMVKVSCNVALPDVRFVGCGLYCLFSPWLILEVCRSYYEIQEVCNLSRCGLQGQDRTPTFVGRLVRHPGLERRWTATLRRRSPWSCCLVPSHWWWWMFLQDWASPNWRVYFLFWILTAVQSQFSERERRYASIENQIIVLSQLAKENRWALCIYNGKD